MSYGIGAGKFLESHVRATHLSSLQFFLNCHRETMLEVYELFDFSSLIEWHSVRTPMLVVALVVVGSIGTVIKYMFINFIWRHAPANRPINSLLMKDQV